MPFVERLQQREERFLVSHLDRARQVFVFLLERLVRCSRRTEKIDQRPTVEGADHGRAILPAVGNVSDVVPEIFQVQPKAAIELNEHDFTAGSRETA